jgi:3-methyladenine DNA glycosylase AlkD
LDREYDAFDVKAMAHEIDARLRALGPGARTPEVRAVRRAYSRRLAGAAPEQVFALAFELLTTYGHRWVSYELVHDHRAARRSLGTAEVERFGQGIDSWGTVDAFARTLSGPAWREGQVADEVIHAWARSPDRWWRRAALVSTVALNVRSRGGRGDVPRTLEVCRMLVADGEDMVVKAMSWALRELVPHDPDAVGAFLDEGQGVLAARVQREVRNKLETGLKNPRRTARRV